MGSIKKDVDMFPSDLEFAIFSGEEIKKLSVTKIITGLTFDSLGHALPGGLYDNAMGSYGRSMDPCGTCFSLSHCPGHFGYIELSAKVYNPFFIKLVRDILKIFCLNCHKVQMKNHTAAIVTLQLKLIEAGYLIEAQEMEVFKSEYVCQNSNELVKTESGDLHHPHIAQMNELLAQGKRNHINNTKTLYAIRSALVHSALQNPVSKRCIHCNKPLKKIRYLYKKLVIYMTKDELKDGEFSEKLKNSGHHKVFLADECQKHLREIYSNYSEFLELLFPILKLTLSNNKQPTDGLFMDYIAVTPPKARPTNVLLDQIIEHPTTMLYRRIIENNSALRVIMMNIKNDANISEEATAVYQSSKGDTPHEKMYYAWQSLQTSVDCLLDADASREFVVGGLKQVLEKKEGLIRKHMMGKRVNYAARTVITPDPNISVEEVGIPDIFAKHLSYPVPVTPWNVAELRKMVMNGPNIHPGANFIEDEKGYTSLIPPDNAAKRESMAKLLFTYPENGTKIVHRHVLNGDIVLLNRQPSLHKPSIMAHKVRILQGEKTFRLHYSNCKAYNADFDGDEMNAHLPQNEVARSEAYNFVNVANNYLVPKDGTPLGGLIQDHVISGVKLSMRGRFFNREDYHQLVFQALPDVKGDIKLLQPAIMKPIALWSGKQILSTIIINIIPKGYPRINLTSKAKIGGKHWQDKRKDMRRTDLQDDEMCESQVIIRDGELLVGVLDKQQYGATQYGLVHCMYELYGGSTSCKLLTALTKVFTFFLQREGFTLGIHDILVTSEADKKRRKIVRESREIGNSIVASLLDLDEQSTPSDVIAKKMEEAYVNNPKFRVLLDRKYKSILDGYTNDINRTCLPSGLISKFPSNNLQLMVLSGAKGSMVNTMQISCLLGQIELEGKRPPLMISGKSLPSFPSFETSPKSGGFIDGRFMTGIQPQDFFFHCMAGREGLIDTAVKTSRSGYLQRCLIKHLEGLKVDYDLTVRDSDKSVVQFLYGEDGLDILKSTFFNEKCLKFLDENSSVILRPEDFKKFKDTKALATVSEFKKKIKSWNKKQIRAKIKDPTYKLRSDFTHFSSELQNDIEITNPKELNLNIKTGRLRISESLAKLWRKADVESKNRYREKFSKCPDPSLSKFNPDCFYSSVSENIEKLIQSYGDKNPKRKATIADIMYLKNMKSLAHPGESVGLLAAQSIGEPSTQMTLNTFHFAGRGEMNVTLGIPRLREILMLASSNIKTPSMDIPILPNQEKAAEKLRINLNRVTLADVLEYVNVKRKLILEPRAHQYQIHFQFLPREAYAEDFCVRPKYILKEMSAKFFKFLFRAIIKSSKSKDTMLDIDTDKSTKSSKGGQNFSKDDFDNENPNKERENDTNIRENNDSSGDEDVNEDENDATGIKLKSQKVDETEYDEPEVDEEINDANDDDDDVIAIDNDMDNSVEFKDVVVEDDEEIFEQIEKVLDNEMVTDYTYDRIRNLWCKLTFNLSIKHKNPDMTSVIRDIARKFVLHEVDKIKRAIMYKNQDELTLKTDGINIVEMFEYHKILDLRRLYSNDIHAIAKTYGIEAAAKVIVKEVQNVFKVYGITVDIRHLSLIADYMTFDGTFQPLSRKGMEHSASPLQQMSFESCMQFLKSATVHGHHDDLKSPSSRLIVGLPVENGTGCFDLLTKISYEKKKTK